MNFLLILLLLAITLPCSDNPSASPVRLIPRQFVDFVDFVGSTAAQTLGYAVEYIQMSAATVEQVLSMGGAQTAQVEGITETEANFGPAEVTLGYPPLVASKMDEVINGVDIVTDTDIVTVFGNVGDTDTGNGGGGDPNTMFVTDFITNFNDVTNTAAFTNTVDITNTVTTTDTFSTTEMTTTTTTSSTTTTTTTTTSTTTTTTSTLLGGLGPGFYNQGGGYYFGGAYQSYPYGYQGFYGVTTFTIDVTDYAGTTTEFFVVTEGPLTVTTTVPSTTTTTVVIV